MRKSSEGTAEQGKTTQRCPQESTEQSETRGKETDKRFKLSPFQQKARKADRGGTQREQSYTLHRSLPGLLEEGGGDEEKALPPSALKGNFSPNRLPNPQRFLLRFVNPSRTVMGKKESPYGDGQLKEREGQGARRELRTCTHSTSCSIRREREDSSEPVDTFPRRLQGELLDGKIVEEGRGRDGERLCSEDRGSILEYEEGEKEVGRTKGSVQRMGVQSGGPVIRASMTAGSSTQLPCVETVMSSGVRTGDSQKTSGVMPADSSSSSSSSSSPSKNDSSAIPRPLSLFPLDCTPPSPSKTQKQTQSFQYDSMSGSSEMRERGNGRYPMEQGEGHTVGPASQSGTQGVPRRGQRAEAIKDMKRQVALLCQQLESLTAVRSSKRRGARTAGKQEGGGGTETEWNSGSSWRRCEPPSSVGTSFGTVGPTASSSVSLAEAARSLSLSASRVIEGKEKESGGVNLTKQKQSDAFNSKEIGKKILPSREGGSEAGIREMGTPSGLFSLILPHSEGKKDVQTNTIAHSDPDSPLAAPPTDEPKPTPPHATVTAFASPPLTAAAGPLWDDNDGVEFGCRNSLRLCGATRDPAAFAQFPQAHGGALPGSSPTGAGVPLIEAGREGGRTCGGEILEEAERERKPLAGSAREDPAGEARSSLGPSRRETESLVPTDYLDMDPCTTFPTSVCALSALPSDCRSSLSVSARRFFSLSLSLETSFSSPSVEGRRHGEIPVQEFPDREKKEIDEGSNRSTRGGESGRECLEDTSTGSRVRGGRGTIRAEGDTREEGKEEENETGQITNRECLTLPLNVSGLRRNSVVEFQLCGTAAVEEEEEATARTEQVGLHSRGPFHLGGSVGAHSSRLPGSPVHVVESPSAHLCRVPPIDAEQAGSFKRGDGGRNAREAAWRSQLATIERRLRGQRERESGKRWEGQEGRERETESGPSPPSREGSGRGLPWRPPGVRVHACTAESGRCSLSLSPSPSPFPTVYFSRSPSPPPFETLGRLGGGRSPGAAFSRGVLSPFGEMRGGREGGKRSSHPAMWSVSDRGDGWKSVSDRGDGWRSVPSRPRGDALAAVEASPLAAFRPSPPGLGKGDVETLHLGVQRQSEGGHVQRQSGQEETQQQKRTREKGFLAERTLGPEGERKGGKGRKVSGGGFDGGNRQAKAAEGGDCTEGPASLSIVKQKKKEKTEGGTFLRFSLTLPCDWTDEESLEENRLTQKRREEEERGKKTGLKIPKAKLKNVIWEESPPKEESGLLKAFSPFQAFMSSVPTAANLFRFLEGQANGHGSPLRFSTGPPRKSPRLYIPTACRDTKRRSKSAERHSATRSREGGGDSPEPLLLQGKGTIHCAQGHSGCFRRSCSASATPAARGPESALCGKVGERRSSRRGNPFSFSFTPSSREDSQKRRGEANLPMRSPGVRQKSALNLSSHPLSQSLPAQQQRTGAESLKEGTQSPSQANMAALRALSLSVSASQSPGQALCRASRAPPPHRGKRREREESRSRRQPVKCRLVLHHQEDARNGNAEKSSQCQETDTNFKELGKTQDRPTSCSWHELMSEDWSSALSEGEEMGLGASDGVSRLPFKTNFSLWASAAASESESGGLPLSAPMKVPFPPVPPQESSSFSHSPTDKGNRESDKDTKCIPHSSASSSLGSFWAVKRGNGPGTSLAWLGCDTPGLNRACAVVRGGGASGALCASVVLKTIAVKLQEFVLWSPRSSSLCQDGARKSCHVKSQRDGREEHAPSEAEKELFLRGVLKECGDVLQRHPAASRQSGVCLAFAVVCEEQEESGDRGRGKGSTLWTGNLGDCRVDLLKRRGKNSSQSSSSDFGQGLQRNEEEEVKGEKERDRSYGLPALPSLPCPSFESERLSEDHSASCAAERSRVASRGGEAVQTGGRHYRVFRKGGNEPGFSFTRALGYSGQRRLCGLSQEGSIRSLWVPSSSSLRRSSDWRKGGESKDRFVVVSSGGLLGGGMVGEDPETVSVSRLPSGSCGEVSLETVLGLQGGRSAKMMLGGGNGASKRMARLCERGRKGLLVEEAGAGALGNVCSNWLGSEEGFAAVSMPL
uniref:PPM-type phosphatase domain-containing protein n=1 Tax=Chromera velia CCMP2878 TaxID=1169474 RepID=A0A0G4GBG7_9ALVE|eukprot:Cvel_4456.t1-p1 / transcript=Cvel_4456.t1 / gene=Cvel_4456 / organism=Chromera_velia_CCMP2878 / gene_product=hypothetical protein / transcript_product=hypothetical protein / location=Cvel_scaffold194:83423-92350(+) / protein_length=2058 / sequence_SO=supercontig / SO=protein_coding / is_pseudo=false